MSGGLVQLVAYGAQDVYLTGNPKITFFQTVYKRHTNFALETIQQNIDGSATNGSVISCTLQRAGDLLGEVYVQLKPKAGLFKTSNNVVADCNWVAERAFSDVEWQIGGQRIDKHYQVWWRLYSEVYMNVTQKIDYAKMTTAQGNYSDSSIVYLPLLFSFCRNKGLYLPLIALQFHEVKIIFGVHNSFSDYFEGQPIVWAQYVLLDKDERSLFATKDHEYLIEQVQHDGGTQITAGTTETSSTLTRITFNHPVKELVWCYQTTYSPTNRNSMWNFTSNTSNVQVTCNPQVIYNNKTLISPQNLGVPLFVTGTNSNVFSGDGEFGNNFQNGLAGFSRLGPLSVSSTTGPNTITFTGAHGLRIGDVVTLANAPSSGVPGISGLTGNFFYFVTGTPSVTAINVSTSWSPTLSNVFSQSQDAGLVTATPTGLTMYGLRPVGAGYSQVSILPVNFIDANGAVNILNTSGFRVNSISQTPNQLGVIFSNNFGTTNLSGNLFYVSSIDDQFSNIMISNTFASNGLFTTDKRFNTGALAANQLSAMMVSLSSNIINDNRPITCVPVEDGVPGPNVEVGPLHKFKIMLNGRERFMEQFGKYFNQVQSFYHHPNTTRYPGIYSYSFALSPEDHQPTGTCNFSRIDMAQAQHWMKQTSTPTGSLVTKMFAVNYNILKISSGMGGIMFSN